jgi:hypothetical protein
LQHSLRKLVGRFRAEAQFLSNGGHPGRPLPDLRAAVL